MREMPFALYFRVTWWPARSMWTAMLLPLCSVLYCTFLLQVLEATWHQTFRAAEQFRAELTIAKTGVTYVAMLRVSVHQRVHLCSAGLAFACGGVVRTRPIGPGFASDTKVTALLAISIKAYVKSKPRRDPRLDESDSHVGGGAKCHCRCTLVASNELPCFRSTWITATASRPACDELCLRCSPTFLFKYAACGAYMRMGLLQLGSACKNLCCTAFRLPGAFTAISTIQRKTRDDSFFQRRDGPSKKQR